jgi:DNA-binding NtrC family response regulator
LPPLAHHFLGYFSRQLGKRLDLSAAALECLSRYDWPGNVRELRNVVERAAVLADPVTVLEPDDFNFDVSTLSAPLPRAGSAGSLFEEIAEVEAERIRDALRKAGGSKARAARILGIPRTTLNNRLRRLDIT